MIPPTPNTTVSFGSIGRLPENVDPVPFGDVWLFNVPDSFNEGTFVAAKLDWLVLVDVVSDVVVAVVAVACMSVVVVAVVWLALSSVVVVVVAESCLLPIFTTAITSGSPYSGIGAASVSPQRRRQRTKAKNRDHRMLLNLRSHSKLTVEGVSTSHRGFKGETQL